MRAMRAGRGRRRDPHDLRLPHRQLRGRLLADGRGPPRSCPPAALGGLPAALGRCALPRAITSMAMPSTMPGSGQQVDGLMVDPPILEHRLGLNQSSSTRRPCWPASIWRRMKRFAGRDEPAGSLGRWGRARNARSGAIVTTSPCMPLDLRDPVTRRTPWERSV